MTDEEIRIKVAESLGLCIEEYRMEDGTVNIAALPNYLTSRDAICGAVAKLDDMRFCYFVEHLERVCGTDGWEIMGSEDRRKVLLATPSQMADALLLTLGHVIL